MTMKKIAILCSLLLSFTTVAKTDLIDVGLSTVDLELPEGAPLAGYGQASRRVKGGIDLKNKYPYCFFFKPNEGVLDPVYVRTMALRKDGKIVIFVSMDVVGITHDFVKDLVKRLKDYGINRNNLNLSGTHTHSGPGALSHNFALGAIAADLFNKKLFNHVMNKVVNSVKKAILNLEPAYLYDLTFQTQGLQKNRRKVQGHFDDKARFLLAKNLKGDWLGGILNFAVHGTSLGGSNLKLSGDIPGAMVNSLVKKFHSLNMLTDVTPTILFINGAEGDVAPRHGGHRNMAPLSQSLATQTMNHLKDARPVLNPQINFRRERVFVGIPKISLKKCIDEPKISKWIPSFFKIPMMKLLPWKTSISTVSIGDITMMTWPGEPTTSVGFRLQNIARNAGHPYPWVMGLTNDHLSYFTTKEEFKIGGYEACSSFYSYRGTRRILKKFTEILKK